jgi:peptidoglycan/LPS O-acetylase OafA/YrhL
MRSNRVTQLDILRAAAIFGVLVLHSSFQNRFNKETLAVQGILARLFDWAVLAFFFSSGCLYDRSAKFVVALKKRAISLLVPFFLYNALYNLSFAATESMGWVSVPAAQHGSFTLASFFLQSPGFQLYFLPYLFLVSVLVCMADKLTGTQAHWMRWIMLLSIFIFYLIRGYPDFSFGPAYSNLPLYLAAFICGVIGRPILDEPFANAWVIAVALTFVLVILALSPLPIVSLAVPPLLAALAGSVPKMNDTKVLLFVGAISGSIYLWHTPILLPGITRLLAASGIPSLFNLLGSICLTLVLCSLFRAGLDALFRYAFKRPAPRFITL